MGFNRLNIIFAFYLTVVLAPISQTASLTEIANDTGAKIKEGGSWFKDKALPKGDHLVNSLIESVAKAFVDNMVKLLVTSNWGPKINSKLSQSLPPYEYEIAETLLKYPHNLKQMILDEETYIQVMSFVKNLKKTDKKNDGLPRMILYGAPGVGKTEIARRIVNEGNFVMKMVTGNEFARMTPDKVKHFMSYVDKARNNGRKVILFIDEGETLFKDRYGNRSAQLQNFIAQTGSRSAHFTMIVATNFAEQFDDAAFRRFDYKVRIRLPSASERKRIFLHYLKKYLADTPSVEMDFELYENPSFMETFNKSSEGLSPNDIQQLAELVVTEAEIREEPITDKRIIYRIEELHDKKDELLAQKEISARKRKDDARAAYLEDKVSKKFAELGGDGEEVSAGLGKGAEQVSAKK